MYEPHKMLKGPSSTGEKSSMNSVARTDAVSSPAQTNELLAIVDRLKEIIDAETEALAEKQVTDLTVFTRKKSQILLEVTRLTRQMKLPTGSELLHHRLEGLTASLEHNRSSLETHLRAAGQLTDIISNAVQAADSDGTYSAAGVGDRFI